MRSMSVFRYYIHTFGCQMNVHDSEEMAGLMESIGLLPAKSEEEADIILLNTCSVRDKADQKLFTKLGRVGKLKETKPDLLISVCGCIAQRDGEALLKRAPFVDLVLGTRSIARLPVLIQEVRETGVGKCCISMDGGFAEFEIFRRSSKAIAYVTIMEGCNNFCSYCIVPFVRGREISRSAVSIIDEVEKLAGAGYLEVHLLGQNVNSYYDSGKDFTFSRLLRSVARVSGIERIRFITSHPKDFSEEIVAAMAEEGNICNAIHLPPQSGSNKVLEAMNRKYSREQYLEKIQILKRYLKSVALSGDFIVGFPGETDSDFEQTLSLVEEVEFAQLFTFIYSPRPGTKAADLDDDIPREKKVERLIRLQELQNSIQLRKNSEKIGSEEIVLIDGFAAKGGGQKSARTEGNVVVNMEAPDELIGKIVPVVITGAGVHSLRGDLARKLDKKSV